ncbi:MAG: response regulator [Deltaproteobacteria bacterium]|nr:response regulator [Deltaproteobacteria bacterium]
MSSKPDSQNPDKSSAPGADRPKTAGSGVWRFALEGYDSAVQVPPAREHWVGRMHSGEATHISMYLASDGVLLSRPVGNLDLLSIDASADVGANIRSLLDQEFADALLERVRASISLHAEVQGAVDAQIGETARKLQFVLSPGHARDVPQGCVVTLRDVTGAAGSNLADPFNWQSTVALASGIAHRFNNLLVAITGNAGLLKTCLPPDHPEQGAIQDMEQAARDMASMTRYLLAFAGEGRYATRPASVNELASQALVAINPALYPNVRLVETFDPELPPIEADPGQIEQAIFNLVMNAVEALASKGGTVELITEKVPAESCVRITIKDDGPGISEPVRGRIFEPFFTTKAPGRGLGLPAVLGIARGHRGSLRVRTAVGTGTVVELYLPYSEATVRPPASKRRKPRAGERNTVLVIDDDPGTVRVLQRTLQSQGYSVITAGDGEHALALVEQRKADIALSIVDMGLPDTSGDLLCAQLKKLMPNVPVVVCSGYADANSAQQVADAGADGFLAKPFNREELGAAVRKAVGAAEGDK